MNTVHTPVLLQEVLDSLNVRDGGTYVDATLGGAGHAEAIVNAAPRVTVVGIDADAEAVKTAAERLAQTGARIVTAITPNHLLDEVLSSNHIETVDGFLFDLGMSSDQLESRGRGFSFQKDEPLLMTMKADPTESDLTAREIVNTWAEESIRDIVWGYGEERFAGRIAHAIVEARKERSIETTTDLVQIIKAAVPGWYAHRKTHPATKVFQALRITVNDEIEHLKVALEKAFAALRPGGRIAVITFHSIEDRIVKRYFKQLHEEEKGTLITKKPIKPTKVEITNNPRARSAQLRVIEKNEQN